MVSVMEPSSQVHDFRSKIWRHHRVPWPRFLSRRRRNFGDSATNKGRIAHFSLRMHKTAICYFRSKIRRRHRLPRPRFHVTRGNFGVSWTFKGRYCVFYFCMGFQDLWVKMGIFRGKIMEGMGRYWPPTNSFLLLWVRLCPIWWKSTKKCDRESVHRRTDTHTQTQNDIIICPMLYAIAMGQIIILLLGLSTGSTHLDDEPDRTHADSDHPDMMQNVSTDTATFISLLNVHPYIQPRHVINEYSYIANNGK